MEGEAEVWAVSQWVCGCAPSIKYVVLYSAEIEAFEGETG